MNCFQASGFEGGASITVRKSWRVGTLQFKATTNCDCDEVGGFHASDIDLSLASPSRQLHDLLRVHLIESVSRRATAANIFAR